jgi:hypothetical protein
MKNVSCIVFFDPLGDFVWEKASCEDCWKVWLHENQEFTCAVTWKFTDSLVELKKLIPGADFVFFDYGGLCLMGHESLGFSFARELEKSIIDRPSVEFILLCTMGKYWYEDHYEKEYPNLHMEDVDWHNLFDKYLGGINV